MHVFHASLTPSRFFSVVRSLLFTRLRRFIRPLFPLFLAPLVAHVPFQRQAGFPYCVCRLFFGKFNTFEGCSSVIQSRQVSNRGIPTALAALGV